MAEDQKSSRDAQGRWVKGVSGNPAGRPDKYANIDYGDFERFVNTVREVDTPEGRIVMTREAAIQHRLYQSAMQGNVHAQIFLSRRIEQSKRDKADITAKFDELVFRLKEEKREPTQAEALWIHQVRMLLHEVPRPKSKFVRTGKHRSRRKPKPKDGGSDPSKS